MARQVWLVTECSDEGDHVMVVTTTYELAVVFIKKAAEAKMAEYPEEGPYMFVENRGQNNLWTIYDPEDCEVCWYEIDAIDLVEG